LTTTKIREKVGKRSKEISSNVFGILCQIPVLFFILVVVIFPLAYAFYLSLFQNNLRKPYENAFIGFTNYYNAVTNPIFLKVLQNTILFTVGSVLVILLLSLGFGILLNERIKGRGLARVLLLIPWAIPGVVNGLMWRWIYNTDFGVLNGYLGYLGLIQRNISWLTEPNLAMLMTIMTHAWKEFPFATLLLLAGLAAIPEDLIDAAKIDGAGVWGRFRYVTIHLIKPMIILVLIFETMWALWAFDIIYALTRGGPSGATTTLGYYLYEVAFRWMDMGQGAALSYLFGAVIVVITFLYIRALYREVRY